MFLGYPMGLSVETVFVIIKQHQVSLVVLGLVVAVLCVAAYFGYFAWALPVGDGPVPRENEVVMSPGMKVEADTPSGRMIITAGLGLKRSYTWDGETRSVEMIPRKSADRRDMGIYFPGAGEHWISHHGITRGCLQEGCLHFKSEKEMLRWLNEKPGFVPRVYSNDGLAIWVLKTPGRNQLNVDLFQVDINGVKPTIIPGAVDGKIHTLLQAQPDRPNSP
jgi:hypothetical protein